MKNFFFEIFFSKKCKKKHRFEIIYFLKNFNNQNSLVGLFSKFLCVLLVLFSLFYLKGNIKIFYIPFQIKIKKA